MAISGGCHCGNISFELERSASPPPARACQCSFCRMHGAVSISDPAGTLRIAVRDAARLSRYRFGALRLADMLVCSDCGVYVGAVIDTPTGLRGTINARSARDFALPEGVPADVANETAEERRSRRERTWTPATVT